MAQYYVEVFTTENVETKVKRFFKVVCGAAQRISKEAYRSLEDHAEGAECFQTVSTDKHIKQYKTLKYFIQPSV